jgi:hypothetical protein
MGNHKTQSANDNKDASKDLYTYQFIIDLACESYKENFVDQRYRYS